MVKKTITYTDYDGNQRTEDFYFNLTKAELMELEMSVEGGFRKMAEKIVAANNSVQIMHVFKDLILKSYGEKSDDGRRFIKSKELSEAFTQTEAYSQLFMEFLTDGNAAAAFMNGIVPSDLSSPDVKQQ